LKGTEPGAIAQGQFILNSERELERRLKNKKGQEGQEGAKTTPVFLPLLALLVLSCRKTAFSR
jgi:hypothetical protein